MSFKSMVIQDGPSRFVLPKIKTMNAEVVAFLSPEAGEGRCHTHC